MRKEEERAERGRGEEGKEAVLRGRGVEGKQEEERVKVWSMWDRTRTGSNLCLEGRGCLSIWRGSKVGRCCKERSRIF